MTITNYYEHNVYIWLLNWILQPPLVLTRKQLLYTLYPNININSCCVCVRYILVLTTDDKLIIANFIFQSDFFAIVVIIMLFWCYLVLWCFISLVLWNISNFINLLFLNIYIVINILYLYFQMIARSEFLTKAFLHTRINRSLRRFQCLP